MKKKHIFDTSRFVPYCYALITRVKVKGSFTRRVVFRTSQFGLAASSSECFMLQKYITRR